MIQDVIPDLDDANDTGESADSATSYSEEGKP